MRTIVVTGGTDGIGLATAEALGQLGHRVVITGRSAGRVDAALELLASKQVRAEGVAFDLGVPDAVRKGAAQLRAMHATIDVLINNAGIFAAERLLTAQGVELTFAVNALGPYILTESLMPALLASPTPIVINVASIAHTRGRIHLDDLTLKDQYTGYAAYAQSKLANVMHALDIGARFPTVHAYSLHPGVVGTKLLRQGFAGVRGELPAIGAKTAVALATGELRGARGAYFSDGRETPPASVALHEPTRAALMAYLKSAANCP